MLIQRWAKLELPGDIYHVVPVEDEKEHEADDCWCQPDLTKFPNGNTMVTHKAADYREQFEKPLPVR